MKLKITHYVLIVVGFLIAGGVVWAVARSQQQGPADALAQCLTEKGVAMYGAYWCTHCQNQKKLFGNSWKHIIYIECSLPGGRGQTQECTDAGIKGYPTWMMPGGLQLSGERTFEELAQASGCMRGDALGIPEMPSAPSVEEERAMPGVGIPEAE